MHGLLATALLTGNMSCWTRLMRFDPFSFVNILEGIEKFAPEMFQAIPTDAPPSSMCLFWNPRENRSQFLEMYKSRPDALYGLCELFAESHI